MRVCPGASGAHLSLPFPVCSKPFHVLRGIMLPFFRNVIEQNVAFLMMPTRL